MNNVTVGIPTPTISTPFLSTTQPTTYPTKDVQDFWNIEGPKFPYLVVVIVILWFLLIVSYFISRWRQKPKDMYIVPRVFVLCSPRNVQFHYELILRVGLPSYDFNPEKYDIDLSVQGQQKNEVVPTTRLNTRTLIDEPLITNLSLVVYRLVEMPPLGALLLNHSGPFKSWIYAYDFTVIDLSTNKEQYYTINQYIGALSRLVQLEEPNSDSSVNFPIDDVPLPQWSLEDIFLIIYATLNYIMLLISIGLVNCDFINDILTVLMAALGGGILLFFLNWLIYYQVKWGQERREFFNETTSWRLMPSESTIRICVTVIATLFGAATVYFVCSITSPMESIIWLMAVINSCILVVGLWNAARLADLAKGLVSLGLRLRGIEMVSVGMRYSEMVPDTQTKSGSASDDGSSTISGQVSKMRQGFGTRSSVKSFGFSLLGQRGKQNHHSAISSVNPSSVSRSSRIVSNSSYPRSMMGTGGSSLSIPASTTVLSPTVVAPEQSIKRTHGNLPTSTSHTKSYSQSKSKKGSTEKSAGQKI